MNNDDNHEDLDDVNYSIDFDPEETPGAERVESEGVLSYAFDHIYAITPENAIRGSSLAREDGPAARLQALHQQKVYTLTTSLNNTQTEVKRLKSLISAHLDLIQKQSDIIASKDKQVKACIVENELLKKRLERCGAGDSQPSHLSISDSLFSTSKSQIHFFDTLLTSPDSQSFSLPFPDNFISSDPSTSGHFYPSHTANISGKMKSHEQSSSRPSGRHSSQRGELATYSNRADRTEISSKSSKSGKVKTKSNSLQYSTTIPYTRGGNGQTNNSRKRSTESYIKKNYKLEKTTNSDQNPFRKIETSCRDFSYGETISNIGSNILSNIERANNTPSENSTIWHNEEAVFKKIDIMGINSLVSVADLSGDLKKEHGKGKGKKSKKASTPVPDISHRSDSNAIIRSMFLADLSAEQLPAQPHKTLDIKKDCQDLYDCDNSESIINLDILPKKEDIQKRGTSPSASVYSFNEDSQDTKVIGSRKANEPRLSVTESLNRMGKRRSRAFGVFGDSGNEEKPPGPPSNGRKRAQSTSSRVSTVSQAESTSSMQGILESKILFKNKNLSALSAVDPYYTPVGAAAQPEKQETLNSLEVPKWRIHRIQPQTSRNCENEENVDDIVFNKRHSKMESEERRIKRWDLQRLKVLHLKKAKDRKEKVNLGGKKLHYGSYKSVPSIPDSLWQSTENVLAIELTEDLPVTSFGELVPLFKPRKFHLPWIPRQRGSKKSKCHRLEKKNKGKDGEDHFFLMTPLRF